MHARLLSLVAVYRSHNTSSVSLGGHQLTLELLTLPSLHQIHSPWFVGLLSLSGGSHCPMNTDTPDAKWREIRQPTVSSPLPGLGRLGVV